MADAGGANRIELESQILCAALRQSWADNDMSGQVKSCSELYQLFPDLVPALKAVQTERPRNNYEVLGIDCDVPPSVVVAAYFRTAKNFLRENNAKEKRLDYFHILDAGFVLRKPRLRLSHDLIVSRSNLLVNEIIPEDGTFEMVDVEQAAPQPAVLMVTQPIVQAPLPTLIELLRHAQIIAAAEVQALTNQMRSFPDVPVADLILSAGYVTEGEMKSLQLGEFLLGQGKIDIGQFCVAMYDERTTGVKMAESLQVRGWLSTEVAPYRRPDN